MEDNSIERLKQHIERIFGWHIHSWLYTFGYEGWPIRKKCMTCGKIVG